MSLDSYIDYGRVLFTSNIDLSHNLDNQFGGTKKKYISETKIFKVKSISRCDEERCILPLK